MCRKTRQLQAWSSEQFIKWNYISRIGKDYSPDNVSFWSPVLFHVIYICNFCDHRNFEHGLRDFFAICFSQDLPDNELFWPPITLRVMDIRNFGRETLVGTATISNVIKYVYVPEEERRRKEEEARLEKERIQQEREREQQRLAMRDQVGELKEADHLHRILEKSDGVLNETERRRLNRKRRSFDSSRNKNNST